MSKVIPMTTSSTEPPRCSPTWQGDRQMLQAPPGVSLLPADHRQGNTTSLSFWTTMRPTSILRSSLAKRPCPYLHVTPTSAFWLNQVERWFGLISQRAIKRVDSVAQLVMMIEAFIANHNASPFVWAATTESIFGKLGDYLRVFAGHDTGVSGRHTARLAKRPGPRARRWRHLRTGRAPRGRQRGYHPGRRWLVWDLTATVEVVVELCLRQLHSDIDAVSAQGGVFPNRNI